MKLLILFLLLTLPLVDATVKEELQPKLNELEQFNLAKYKAFLPLTVKVNSLDKNESFLVKLNKDGKISFADEGKVDIVIQGNEKNLINVLNSDENNFNNINVYGTSFKGKISLIIAEKITKTKFNKNKTVGDKILGAVIYPVTLFFN
ncbi:MAG: hypothetical protein AABW45_02305 [Nanoarchaeota archaeon]